MLIQQTYSYFRKDNFSVNVVYPGPSEKIALMDKPLFLFGTVSPKEAKLKVNGVEAEVDADGAFLVYAPVIVTDEKDGVYFRGKFVFKITSEEREKEVERFVWVRLPSKTSPVDYLGFDNSWRFQPNQNIELQTGENVDVEFKATPGCKGFFNVEGINKDFPLVETSIVNSYDWAEAIFGSGFSSKGNTIEGIYKGHFFVNQKLSNAKITVTLIHPKFGRIKQTASGSVSTIDNQMHRVVQIKHDPNLTVGRFGPAKGYKLFLPEGVKLEITGREGEWLRAKLSNSQNIYIPNGSFYNLPLGTPPPKSGIQIIRTKEFEKFSSVQLSFWEKLPFEIIQQNDPQKIEMNVFNVNSNIDFVFYDRKSDFIREIRHSQPIDGVLKVEIYLNQKAHWGYSTFYDGNILNLRINKPAKKNSKFLFWQNQLENRIIAIDPGHSADDGSIGPRGTKEKDVNYQISVKLKEILEDAGATAYLTRGKAEDLPLNQRKAKVNSFNPEVTISIHNNAVPQSVNPLVHNGSSVYYYFPQALPLSKFVHQKFLEKLKLKDFGLYWDNLYMTRITESISILVEPAFMIVPEQEKLLRDEEFQYKIAESIFEGIEKFYEEYAE